MNNTTTQKFYTIAIGSYCDRDLESHETEEKANVHAEAENKRIINEVFGDDSEKWSDDPESTQYIVVNENELSEYV